MSLTVTNALLDGERTRLRVEDGAIVKIGPRIRPRDGDEVIDADGMAIVPGLINGHTHAAMTLFRGHGDDLPLMRWLQEVIWPVEARLDGDDVYWGTRLACVEMIRTGTVRFWDMYWHAGATARAVEDAGIRARIAAPLFDLGDAAGPDGVPEMAARGFEEIGEPGELVTAAFGPHSIYTVSEGALRWIGEDAAERGLPIHIHLSETEDEVVRLRARPRRAARRVPGPARSSGSAHSARSRRLAGRVGAGAGGGARRHRRHQPGVEPEARGGSRVPVPGGAPARDPGRTRDGRRRLQQLAGPPAGREVPGAAPEARSSRPVSAPGRRGMGHRHRPARAAAGRVGPDSGGGAGRLSARAQRRARARARQLRREPGLRGVGVGRSTPRL